MKNTKFSKVIALVFALILAINSNIHSQDDISYFNTGNISNVIIAYPSGTLTFGQPFFGLQEINSSRLDIAVTLNSTVFSGLYSRKGHYNTNNGNGSFGSVNGYFIDETYNGQNTNPISGSVMVKLRDNADRKDLVVLRSTSTQVHWDANGVISNSQQNLGNGGTFIESGKFTSDDTREDIISKAGNSVNVFRNQGDGYLSNLLYTFNVSLYKFKVNQIDDRDADNGVEQYDPSNREDLIVADGNFIKIYLNNNNNSFSSSAYSTIDAGYQILDIDVNDVTGDGYNDIIVTGGTFGNFKASVFKNVQGSFILSTPIWQLNNQSYIYQNPLITSGDINRDGLNDLVIVSQEGNTSVFINNKSGTYYNSTPDQNFSNLYLGGTPVQIKLADIYNTGGQALIQSYGGSSAMGIKVINALNQNPAPIPPVVTGMTYWDGTYFRPYIKFNRRDERDFQRYDIYKLSPNTGGQVVYLGSTTNNEYVDYSEFILTGQSGPNWNCYYYAVLKDNSNQLSSPSNSAYYWVGSQGGGCISCGDGDSPVKNTQLEAPLLYKLSNFPNPFNPVTKIYYVLPKEGNVKITVYNGLGQVVKELVNEFKSIGNYTADFDGSDLSSGIYLYRIESGSYIETKKMLLIK